MFNEILFAISGLFRIMFSDSPMQFYRLNMTSILEVISLFTIQRASFLVSSLGSLSPLMRASMPETMQVASPIAKLKKVSLN
jgi:hypothetical protein